MEVAIIALVISFVLCIGVIFLDFIDLLADIKRSKEAEKIALESLETSHEVDKIFMKMENDLKKMLEEKYNVD